MNLSKGSPAPRVGRKKSRIFTARKPGSMAAAILRASIVRSGICCSAEAKPTPPHERPRSGVFEQPRDRPGRIADHAIPAVRARLPRLREDLAAVRPAALHSAVEAVDRDVEQPL